MEAIDMKKIRIIDDSAFFSILKEDDIPPVCIYCENYNIDETNQNTCKAFPVSIPNEIIQGKNKHQLPYEGDNGIHFKLSPKVLSETADNLLWILPQNK